MKRKYRRLPEVALTKDLTVVINASLQAYFYCSFYVSFDFEKSELSKLEEFLTDSYYFCFLEHLFQDYRYQLPGSFISCLRFLNLKNETFKMEAGAEFESLYFINPNYLKSVMAFPVIHYKSLS